MQQKMPFKINNEECSITHFPILEQSGRGYLALYYEPADHMGKDIKRPTFFATKQQAEDFLVSKKDKEDERIAAFWWN